VWSSSLLAGFSFSSEDVALFPRPVVVIADCDVVFVLFQYGFEVVEELCVVAVVFAYHLVFAFVAGSSFPVEFLIDFRVF